MECGYKDCENMAGPTGRCHKHEKIAVAAKKRSKRRTVSELDKQRAWRQRSKESQARLLKRFG